VLVKYDTRGDIMYDGRGVGESDLKAMLVDLFVERGLLLS
jgi:hypothetical protein